MILTTPPLSFYLDKLPKGAYFVAGIGRFGTKPGTCGYCGKPTKPGRKYCCIECSRATMKLRNASLRYRGKND